MAVNKTGDRRRVSAADFSDHLNPMSDVVPMACRLPRKRIVIVGGGFGGIAAAKALRATPAEIGLVDRRNHHLFQPLLYQVATASLNPSDIAAPLRRIFRSQQNLTVVLGTVDDVSLAEATITVQGQTVAYDYLVLAAGGGVSYFGNDEWASVAPGLKTIEDATEIRRRMLLAFEAAEIETDPAARTGCLTFVIIGGGPTGVELAGAIAEVARHVIPADFRQVDTSAARIVLIEGGDRLLAALPARCSRDLPPG